MWRCKEWVCSCMHKAVQWPEFKVWLSLRTGNMWWTRKHFHVVQSFQKDLVLLTAENKCNLEGLIHECTNMKTQETGAHLNISPTRAHEIVHGNLGYRNVTYQSHQMPQSDAYRFMQQAYDLLRINQCGISGNELSTPWYKNTYRPTSNKKFVTVNSTNKIIAMDFWDTTGILLDGCGLKLQR